MMPALALALAAAAGLGYGLFLEHPKLLPFRPSAKVVPVSLLAIASILAGAPWTLVLALALSAGGDWFLAHEGKPMFLAGLGAFLGAHLAYCWLFASQQDPEWMARPIFLAGAVFVFVVVGGVYRRLTPHLGEFRLPVGLYCGVIGAMLVMAFSRGPDPGLMAGVALFAFSDILLGFETFAWGREKRERRLVTVAVWFCYFAGQWLITASQLRFV